MPLIVPDYVNHNNQTTETTIPAYHFDTDFARGSGIAFAKRCWTTQEILKQETQLFKLIRYNESHKIGIPCGVKPIIHQSELRTYTKVVPFKENSSFRFVAL